MQHLTDHPFSYFGIPVTRDMAVIRQAIQKRYLETKQYENHNNVKFRQRYKDFCDYAALIAKVAGLAAGSYEPDPDKIETIIQHCLERLRPIIVACIDPTNNTIRPGQVAQIKTKTARDAFNIAEDVAGPFVDRVLLELKVKVTDKDPPVPPMPVEGLHAIVGEGQITLRWRLPPRGCQELLIRRTQRGDTSAAREFRIAVADQWVDEQVVAGCQYDYQITPQVQGTQPPSPRTVTVTARGAVEAFVAEAQLRPKRARLQWDLPPNCEAMTLFRSDRPIGDMVDDQGRLKSRNDMPTPIEVGAVREYADAQVEWDRTYYYVVVARHPHGACSPSACRSVTFPIDPPPPADFKVTKTLGRISLSWLQVTTLSDVSFCLIRSRTPNPKAKESERRPLKLPGEATTYDDVEVEPGISYWYFLLTVAGTVVGTRHATVGPVLATQEVRDLEVDELPGQVRLRWQSPANVKRVEVVRAEGRVPAVSSDARTAKEDRGILLSVVNKGRLIDFDVKNGQMYGYRVRCVFAGIDGREETTPGNTKLATPYAIPPLVTGLRAELLHDDQREFDRSVKITWTTPGALSIKVVRATRRPNLAVGASVPFEPNSLGTELRFVQAEEAIDPAPDPEREPFYAVFSVNPRFAVFCGAAQLVAVKNLRVTLGGDNILATWNWPDGCHEADLVCQRDGQNVESQNILRKTDQQSYGLPVGPPGKYTIQLRCRAPSADPLMMEDRGSTVSVIAKSCIRVKWEFERALRDVLFRPRTTPKLAIHIDGDASSMRQLVLVGAVARVPSSSTDGHQLALWEGDPHPNKGRLTLDVDGWRAMNPAASIFCRLFGEPKDATISEVIVEAPPLDRTLLYG